MRTETEGEFTRHYIYSHQGIEGYEENGERFIYRKNILGDITAIYKGANKVAEYEIVIEYAENGLPDNRSYEGVWIKLVAHYVVHKIDFLDITDADDIANIGNFENDTNAWFWELCMNLFGNIFFD